MEIPYEFLGRIFVYVLLITFWGILAALSIGFYSFKKRKFLFPSFVLFMLYLFYSPSKWVCGVFSIRESLVDEILVEVRNAVMLDDFLKKEGPRAIFLPQCMRNASCRARCDPILGYECKICGLCDIGTICEAAGKYGFRVFVIPGGSFVKKIFKTYKPASCIGVACYNELAEAMEEMSFIPVQGVCLLKDGCFNTTVDVAEVVSKMEMCDV